MLAVFLMPQVELRRGDDEELKREGKRWVQEEKAKSREKEGVKSDGIDAEDVVRSMEEDAATANGGGGVVQR